MSHVTLPGPKKPCSGRAGEPVSSDGKHLFETSVELLITFSGESCSKDFDNLGARACVDEDDKPESKAFFVSIVQVTELSEEVIHIRRLRTVRLLSARSFRKCLLRRANARVCAKHLNLLREGHASGERLRGIDELHVRGKWARREERCFQRGGCLEQWPERGGELFTRDGIQFGDWKKGRHVPGGQSERWLLPSWTWSTVQLWPFSTSV